LQGQPRHWRPKPPHRIPDQAPKGTGTIDDDEAFALSSIHGLSSPPLVLAAAFRLVQFNGNQEGSRRSAGNTPT